MKFIKYVFLFATFLPLQISAQSICNDFAFNGVSPGPFSHNTKYIDLLSGTSGSVYVLGSYTDESGVHIMISRLYGNGVLFPSFGIGGISLIKDESPVAMVSTSGGLAIAGSSGVVHKVHKTSGFKFGAFSAAQPSELITDMIADGAFVYVLLQNANGFAIKAYYYNNSSPLTSFGNNGVVDVVTDQPPQGTSHLVRTPDGKFMVALSTSNIAPALESQIVYRFLSDGTLDTSWDGDGVLSEPEGKPYRVTDLLIDGNNKVVVTGNVDINGDDSYIITHRWNDDGTGDQSFGSSGTSAIHTSKGYSADMVISDNNDLVFVGKTADQASKFLLAGYDNDGGETSGFVNEEFLPADPFVQSGRLAKVMRLPSGRLLTCGHVRLTDDSTRGIVAEFNSDGSYTPFANNGIYMPNVVEKGADLDIKQQSDGKYVTVGGHQFAGHGGARIAPAIARFNADGTLDTDFGYRGGSFVDESLPTWRGYYQNLDILSDGKIMAYGGINNGDNLNFFVARYNADGTLDTGFSGDGWLTMKGGCASSSCQQQYGFGTVDSQDRILLMGSATVVHGSNNKKSNVMRLLPNGTLDSSFGNSGVAFLDIGLTENLTTGAIYADNSILVGGHTYLIPDGAAAFKTVATFAKFKPDGTLDENFGENGVVSYCPDDGAAAICLSLRLQDDGILSLIENFDINGNETYTLLRLLPTGQVDTGFGTDGSVEIIALDKTPRKDGLSINTDSNGNILVTGSVQTDGGFTSKYSTTGELLATRSYKSSVWPPLTVLPTGPPLVLTDNQLILIADGDREGFGILCFNLDFPEECVPVVITAHPQSQDANVGENVTFTITATGDNTQYQWQKDGADIAGEISSNLLLSNIVEQDAGDYTCIITNQCSSQLSNTAILGVMLVTGMGEKPSNLITIYPNPSSNYIQLKGLITDGMKATIYSAQGKLIIDKTLSPSQTTIDLKDIPNGTYNLVITNGELVLYKKLLVIN